MGTFLLLRLTIIATAGCMIANFLVPSQVDTTAAVAGASLLAKQVSTQEWLGPLAAIALSPFFGLACLSGVATYGPEWLQNRSALVGPSSPLNNPLLFWMMLGLTIATSLPRFTKVSKPIALVVEKLELYSAVIILIASKYLSDASSGSDPSIALVGDPILRAGFATMPLDVLLSIAAALNIIVVNTIKLAFEILVWLIPIPTIDAILEIANKSVSASLMALYAYSPLLSTALNLLIFASCCLVFFRVKRRLRYTRELLLMPFLERIFFGQSVVSSSFLGFLTTSWNGLPAKTAILVERSSDSTDEVKLSTTNWTRQRRFTGKLVRSESKTGMLMDQVVVTTGVSSIILDVRRGIVGQLVGLEPNFGF